MADERKAHLKQRAYLYVSDDVILKGCRGDGQVCVNCLPMAKKCAMVNRIYLLEENRDFDAWLIIWLRVVI